MFFLKLEERDLQKVLEIASEKGISAERIARLAFLTGLRRLSHDGTIAEVDRPKGHSVRIQRRLDYIRENWSTKSDAEMAKELGCEVPSVQRGRLELGFARKQHFGLTTGNATQSPSEEKRQARQEQVEKLDALIREHYETKNDHEIGQLMNPRMAGSTVRLRRYSLDLKKEPGKRRRPDTRGVRELIDPEEFERMLLHEGYTLMDYIAYKKLGCTRERLRQVAQELGLKHQPKGPTWELTRKARRAGNVKLADRTWLAEQIARCDSISSCAAEIGVSDRDIFFFIRTFGLTHPSIRKHGAETVELQCTNCDKHFVRLKRWVNHRTAQAGADGTSLEFFCTQACSGKWNRNRRRGSLEKQQTFIRQNWRSMSDIELGVHLHLAPSTIEKRRAVLGLRRV